MSDETAVAPERGGCLTAFLVLMMIANPLVGLFYILGGDLLRRGMPDAPRWALPVLAVGAFVQFACAIGIWSWRRWGVYGSCAMALVALVVNFAIGLAPQSAIMGLLGPIILVLLVKPRWAHFR